MDRETEKKIENLLEETTQLKFPFLANAEKKKAVLCDNRTYVESELKTIAGEKYPGADIVDGIWKISVEYADEQFKSLPESKRVNGFYLQELMHYYVERLSDVIFSDNSEEE